VLLLWCCYVCLGSVKGFVKKTIACEVVCALSGYVEPTSSKLSEVQLALPSHSSEIEVTIFLRLDTGKVEGTKRLRPC